MEHTRQETPLSTKKEEVTIQARSKTSDLLTEWSLLWGVLQNAHLKVNAAFFYLPWQIHNWHGFKSPTAIRLLSGLDLAYQHQIWIAIEAIKQLRRSNKLIVTKSLARWPLPLLAGNLQDSVAASFALLHWTPRILSQKKINWDPRPPSPDLPLRLGQSIKTSCNSTNAYPNRQPQQHEIADQAL